MLVLVTLSALLLPFAVICDDAGKYSVKLHYGNVETYVTINEIVLHMESDALRPGNILFSEGNALRTTDGVHTSNIVGDVRVKGYVNGIGSKAKFNLITGFVQVNKTHTILADYLNHCLRIVTRPQNEARDFVGQCTRNGFTNGLGAYFKYPRSVILDNRNANKVFVTDRGNNAIRYIDIRTRLVTTTTRFRHLISPKGITFGDNNDVLVFTNEHYISTYSFSNQSQRVITGRAHTGFRNGNLSTSLFNYPSEILRLAHSVYTVADMFSNVLRVVDVNSNTVVSLCNPQTKGYKNGDVKSCLLTSPNSLMYKDGYLYIGEREHIRRMEVKIEEKNIGGNKTEVKCSSKQTVIQLKPGELVTDVEVFKDVGVTLPAGSYNITIPGSKCKKYLKVVSQDKPKKEKCTILQAFDDLKCSLSDITINSRSPGSTPVDVLPGTTISLPEGRYTLDYGNCTRKIRVKGKREFCNTKKLIKSNLAGYGKYSYISRNGDRHSMTLPVGTYHIVVDNGISACNTSVEILGSKPTWRADITADYSIQCSTIKDSSTFSVLRHSAQQRYTQLDKAFSAEFKTPASRDVSISCWNDTLSVQWPTELFLPDENYTAALMNLLRSRLAGMDTTQLGLVIFSRVPPIIHPQRTNYNGAVARVVLSPICDPKLLYDSTSKSCV